MVLCLLRLPPVPTGPPLGSPYRAQGRASELAPGSGAWLGFGFGLGWLRLRLSALLRLSA